MVGFHITEYDNLYHLRTARIGNRTHPFGDIQWGNPRLLSRVSRLGDIFVVNRLRVPTVLSVVEPPNLIHLIES